MRLTGRRGWITLALVLALTGSLGPADLEGQAAEENHLASVEGVVNGLYQSLSFDVGGEPDWDHVRHFFLDGAIVVFAQGPGGDLRVLSVDGFIQDFQEFHSQIAQAGRSFSEVIVSSDITTHGNISHVLVEFQPHIDGSPAGRKGWDSVELTSVGGEWKIVSITTGWDG